MSAKRPKTASLRYERQYFAQGVRHILGMDEVGRGAWAGPVVVGAVCLPVGDKELRRVLVGVRDSKQLSAHQRGSLVSTIRETALAWGIGGAGNEEIDECGINAATEVAMKRALEDTLNRADFAQPDALFLDAVLWPVMRHIPQVSIVNGDQRSLSIAAASILAKTWRDDMMRALHEQYPEYGFADHVGYGTAKHQSALKQYGPSPVHRMYYRPVQNISQRRDRAE